MFVSRSFGQFNHNYKSKLDAWPNDKVRAPSEVSKLKTTLEDTPKIELTLKMRATPKKKREDKCKTFDYFKNETESKNKNAAKQSRQHAGKKYRE